jgi:hypothetical protein
MKLEEFIAKKPPELRLGQFFWNTFFKHRHFESTHMKESSILFFTQEDEDAVRIIKRYMALYQWEELPDYE